MIDRNAETQKTIRSGSIKTGDGRRSVQPRVILPCSVLTVLFAFESRLLVPLDIQVETMFTWMPSEENSARHSQLPEWGKHHLRDTI